MIENIDKQEEKPASLKKFPVLSNCEEKEKNRTQIDKLIVFVVFLFSFPYFSIKTLFQKEDARN